LNPRRTQKPETLSSGFRDRHELADLEGFLYSFASLFASQQDIVQGSFAGLTTASRSTAAERGSTRAIPLGCEITSGASNLSPSRRELVLLVVVLAAAACGGHARPRVAGDYLSYTGAYGSEAPSVVLAHADGTGAHRIAYGADPVVSPDGRWVAFDVCCERGGVSKLFVVSTSGGKPRLLARTDSLPVWSPSSDRIATIEGNALVSVDLHGHVAVLDRRADVGSGGRAFSPDGRFVVYNWSGASCESDLFVVRAAGGGRRRLTRGTDNSPVWGKHWIAFVREVPGCSGAAGVWRIRPDGTGLERVLPPPRHPGRNGIYGFYPVAWGPKEDALLAEIASPDAWDVAIRVDVATGRFRRVHGYPIDLSRDGRFALAVVGPGGKRQTIVALPFGRRARPGVLAHGEVCCPSWNR
jgi:hypothetical protein